MLKIVTIALSVFIAAPVAAQIYRWVDDRGVTNYGNKPPAGERASGRACSTSMYLRRRRGER